MRITRISSISGETRTKDIDVPYQQYKDWMEGKMIHKDMPQLSPEDREFILSGITQEEWENVYGRDDQFNEPTDEEEKSAT